MALISSDLIPAWTWHSPGHIFIFFLLVISATYDPKNISGKNKIGFSKGIDATTLVALEDVKK